MAVALTTHESELDALRHRLTARLEALRGQVRWRLWLDVASRAVVAIAALVIVSFVIDWWLEISRTARIAYTVLAVGLVAWLTIKSALAIVRLRLEPIELAGELDKAGCLPPSQWIAPRVATVLQLSEARIRDAGYSVPMVDRAVRHSSQALDGWRRCCSRSFSPASCLRSGGGGGFWDRMRAGLATPRWRCWAFRRAV
jgi:hypothetical protein